MTDKELLELAAKASGMNVHWGEAWQSEMMFRVIPRPNSPLVSNYEWNPLKDDGDALRLAVKLDIELYQGDDDGPSVYAGYWGKSERRDVMRLFASEPISDDPYAATRRAIVRAAAEIGKEMK